MAGLVAPTETIYSAVMAPTIPPQRRTVMTALVPLSETTYALVEKLREASSSLIVTKAFVRGRRRSITLNNCSPNVSSPSKKSVVKDRNGNGLIGFAHCKGQKPGRGYVILPAQRGPVAGRVVHRSRSQSPAGTRNGNDRIGGVLVHADRRTGKAQDARPFIVIRDVQNGRSAAKLGREPADWST